MHMSEDSYPDTDHIIQRIDDDCIIINKISYKNSLIISANKLIHPWPVTTLTQLNETTLQPIIALKPDLVLIGTGKQGTLAKPQQLSALYAAHIAVESMSNTAACCTYNALLSEGRNVVAALILEESH